MIKKILISTSLVIVSLIILSALMMLLFSLSLNKQRGSKEELLQSSSQSHKKALIIYQPGVSELSSNVAHRIAKGLNDGGYEVTLNHPGSYLQSDVSKYSLLVFGSPVYAGKSSKALIDYMSRLKASPSSKIVLYSTGSTNVYVELDAMEKALNGLKAYKKTKFTVDMKAENDTIAYNLGKDLAKE